MEFKIFLSPSNQTANIYSTKDKTNECVQCERIAQACKDYLESTYDCEVMIANRSDNMNKRVNVASQWGADFYLAIHTNAFTNKTVRGTETYYYSKDIHNESKGFANYLLTEVSSITGVKRSCKANDNLIEMNTPSCIRSYIEVEFHSNPERAEWIVVNVELIGNTIAKSIGTYFNLSGKSKPESNDMIKDDRECSEYDRPTEPESEAQDKEYFVLAMSGAMSKSDANTLADELIKKNFIVSVCQNGKIL